MRTLILHGNLIDQISDNVLWNLSSLEVLDITNNRLADEAIRKLLFSPSSRIRKLYVQNNWYETYPNEIIYSWASLHCLHIDIFENFQFGDEFLILRNLSEISFYPRTGFSLRNYSFTGLSNSPITNLDLEFSGLAHRPIEADVLLPFKSLRSIRVNIRLTCNIKDALLMMNGLRGNDMDIIDLSGNIPFTSPTIQLDPPDIAPLSRICVREADLSGNAISKLPPNAFFDSTLFKCIKRLRISNNNFQNVDLMPPLLITTFPSIESFDMSNMNSIAEYYKNFGYNKGAETQSFQLEQLRSVKFTIYASDSLQEFIGSGVNLHNEHEPPDYTFIFNAPSLIKLDLSNTRCLLCRPGYHVTYRTALTFLNISRWSCEELNPEFLAPVSGLETLIFRDSGLQFGLRNDTSGIFLRGLHRLWYLDMSDNGIERLHPQFLIDQRKSLTQLLLDGNALDHIPRCVARLDNLEHLSLRNNKLNGLTDEDRASLSRLRKVKVDLQGNRFACTCDNIPTLNWIVKHKDKLINYENIRCSNGSLIHDIEWKTFELNCYSTFWLKFAVTAVVLSVCIILVCTVAIRYRVTMEYAYLRLRMFVFRYRPVSTDEGYTFDAFISYSHHDTNWAINILYKHLTAHLGKQVCVHHKDFQVGNSIADEIIRCIDQSRKVIFVITRHFLESEWSNYELEMARIHAFRSGRSGLIIIMKDSVPISDMPSVLKKIWWRVVCLEFEHDDQINQGIFWDKLKLAIES